MPRYSKIVRAMRAVTTEVPMPPPIAISAWSGEDGGHVLESLAGLDAVNPRGLAVVSVLVRQDVVGPKTLPLEHVIPGAT